jgi:hypothetical protein
MTFSTLKESLKAGVGKLFRRRATKLKKILARAGLIKKKYLVN